MSQSHKYLTKQDQENILLANEKLVEEAKIIEGKKQLKLIVSMAFFILSPGDGP